MARSVLAAHTKISSRHSCSLLQKINIGNHDLSSGCGQVCRDNYTRPDQARLSRLRISCAVTIFIRSRAHVSLTSTWRSFLFRCCLLICSNYNCSWTEVGSEMCRYGPRRHPLKVFGRRLSSCRSQGDLVKGILTLTSGSELRPCSAEV